MNFGQMIWLSILVVTSVLLLSSILESKPCQNFCEVTLGD